MAFFFEMLNSIYCNEKLEKKVTYKVAIFAFKLYSPFIYYNGSCSKKNPSCYRFVLNYFIPRVDIFSSVNASNKRFRGGGLFFKLIPQPNNPLFLHWILLTVQILFLHVSVFQWCKRQRTGTWLMGKEGRKTVKAAF